MPEHTGVGESPTAATTCAWCDRPATTEVTVDPARKAHVRGNVKRFVVEVSRRAPACADHAHPERGTDPPQRQKRTPAEQGSLL